MPVRLQQKRQIPRIFGFPQRVSRCRPFREIVAIQKEKENRTPVQRKIDSHLVHHLKARRGQLPPVLAGLPSHVKFEADGRVLVDIDADVTVALLRQIESSGGTIVASVPRFHSVRAQVQLEAVQAANTAVNTGTQVYGGSAGQWFGEVRASCNALEVELRLQNSPPPPGADGAGSISSASGSCTARCAG